MLNISDRIDSYMGLLDKIIYYVFIYRIGHINIEFLQLCCNDVQSTQACRLWKWNTSYHQFCYKPNTALTFIIKGSGLKLNESWYLSFIDDVVFKIFNFAFFYSISNSVILLKRRMIELSYHTPYSVMMKSVLDVKIFSSVFIISATILFCFT